ncbi:hypothetical protein RSOLAG22IIIB_10563 [Rhizoctonia solani]|uniref:Uncharacterized protein n=1 Tax=Rhizoctonia solani TaxID=456999 RepID=A0A0K6G418_9AGAM|nr:hypothetical protein RSOLAG22IIIB_10563 [Rhizoctonia solani]
MSRVFEELKVDDSLARVASNHESPVKDVNVILVFGCTGTGKTSFANMASGGDMKVGKSVRSSTKHLEATKVFQVDDQPVAVIDCPGFDDTYLTETEILRRLAEFLIEAYEKKHKVVGLLYFHRISDTRVGGANFRHMNMFKALCGKGAIKNVVYVTNMWSEPPLEDEIHREQELRNTSEFFGEPLANGAQMARHVNTPESALDIIRMILGRGHVVTKLQRQLVDEKLPLEETDVGLAIGKDLEDDLRKQQNELNELKAEKEKALGTNDQNWLQRLKTQEERTRVKEQHLVAQLQALKTNETKRFDSSSRRIRVAQGEILNSELSMLQEQAEAKLNQLTRVTRYSDRQSDLHSSGQDEWNKRKNQEIALRVEAIRAGTRRRAGDQRIVDSFLATADFLFGLGAGALSLLRFNRELSPTASVIENSHRSGEGSYPIHRPIQGNQSNMPYNYRYPSPYPSQRPDIPGEVYQSAQVGDRSQFSRPDGDRNAYSEGYGRPVPSRKGYQGNQDAGASTQRFQPSPDAQ